MVLSIVVYQTVLSLHRFCLGSDISEDHKRAHRSNSKFTPWVRHVCIAMVIKEAKKKIERSLGVLEGVREKESSISTHL